MMALGQKYVSKDEPEILLSFSCDGQGEEFMWHPTHITGRISYFTLELLGATANKLQNNWDIQ